MQTGIIQFQGNELLTVRDEINGRIYVAVKPIIENLGLDWKSQSVKINSDSRYGDMLTPFETRGGIQEMLSLPVDQLAAFLYSINPNKVKKNLRENIIAYQQETFNAINDYWNKGFAVKKGTVVEAVPNNELFLLRENHRLAQEIIRLKDVELDSYKKLQVINGLPDGVSLPRRGMYLDESEKKEIAKLWREKHSIAEMMRLTGRSHASIKRYKGYE